MKPRFLADADLNRAIVSGVKRRAPWVDFLNAQDASIAAMPDADVLAMAARDRRILVSHDFGTMPHHSKRSVNCVLEILMATMRSRRVSRAW